ncbi:hypothetical protein Hanom_Chr12g01109231 [Helianthus anomalus]
MAGLEKGVLREGYVDTQVDVEHIMKEDRMKNVEQMVEDDIMRNVIDEYGGEKKNVTFEVHIMILILIFAHNS